MTVTDVLHDLRRSSGGFWPTVVTSVFEVRFRSERRQDYYLLRSRLQWTTRDYAAKRLLLSAMSRTSKCQCEAARAISHTDTMVLQDEPAHL